jgi:hypothetical protein
MWTCGAYTSNIKHAGARLTHHKDQKAVEHCPASSKFARIVCNMEVLTDVCWKLVKLANQAVA